MSAVVAALVVNWFFTPPTHTFTIAQLDNALAVLIFLAVGALVSTVVSLATRRAWRAG